MPNHVLNKLTIQGPEDLVAKIRSEISSINEDGEQMLIDFNKIAPLPEELKGTRPPVMIISQKDYDKQEARIAAGDLEDHEKHFGPSRGITKEMEQALIDKYGCADWYTWQLRAWGTKWNAYNQGLEEDGTIIFSTAWSTPDNLIGRLAHKYPEATFTVRYADEDFGHNVGEYTVRAGTLIEQEIPKGGSQEAYIMACEIVGEWDHITATIEGMEEGDLGETWADNYLKVAYDKGLFGDYPKFVWDYIQKLAIAQEDYEMAQKIKEHLELSNV